MKDSQRRELMRTGIWSSPSLQAVNPFQGKSRHPSILDEWDKNSTELMWGDGRRMWMTREEWEERERRERERRKRMRRTCEEPESPFGSFRLHLFPSLVTQSKSKLSSLLVTQLTNLTLVLSPYLFSSSIDWQPKDFLSSSLSESRDRTSQTDIYWSRKDQMSWFSLQESHLDLTTLWMSKVGGNSKYLTSHRTILLSPRHGDNNAWKM